MKQGLRSDVDSLVRQATLGYGAQFVAVSTAITATYTFAVDMVAQSMGSGAASRSDRAHSYHFKVPSRDSTRINEAINAAQIGIGTLSSVVFALSVLGFAAVSCMLAFECRSHGMLSSSSSATKWGRHSLMTIILWLLMIAIATECYFFYVPLRPGGGIFG